MVFFRTYIFSNSYVFNAKGFVSEGKFNVFMNSFFDTAIYNFLSL